jgi:hypothetical protein
MAAIGETYENDYAKVVKFINNTTLLMKYRRLNEGLREADTGILFTSKTGFRVWLINLYAEKAWIQLIMGDWNGATGLAGYLKTASQAVIRRCAALVNAHLSADRLRFPNRRAPCLPREIRRPFHWGLTACCFASGGS